MSRPAVFVDRDGVINAVVPDAETGLPESPLEVGDVALLADVASPLRELAAAGFLLVGVSNQPAAAKGRVTLEQLTAVHSRVLELLAGEGVRFDDFRVCMHHPEGSDPQLGVACNCRKPAPGMLLDAARELNIDLPGSWTVGDTDADVAAGLAAGTRVLLVECVSTAHRRTRELQPTATVPDLSHAAAHILGPPAG